MWTLPARADDRVVAVFVGPNERAPVFTLGVEDDLFQSISLGERILIEGAPAATFSDIRILPSGGALLADANQRGFLVTDRQGELLFSMGAPRTIPLIASAAVASYANESLPARVLLTDNSTGRAQIYDLIEERYVWNQAFALSTIRGQLKAAIWLPMDRAAIGINWPNLGVYAIDVLPTQGGEGLRPIRYTNIAHNDGPIDQIVVEDLQAVRDLMSYGEGDLLITSQHRLLAIDALGEVLWMINAGDHPAVQGEFASARWLPSGRLALATFEPGQWTFPHTNHRIHWFEFVDGEPIWLARTPILGAAPSRIDAANGHGATGTLNYLADLGGERGSAGDINVVDALSLDASQYRLQDDAQFSAVLRNAGPTAVRLERLFIALDADPSSGACEDIVDESGVEIWQRVPLVIEAGASFVLRGTRTLVTPLREGPWCARLISIDEGLERRVHGPPKAFRIVGSSRASTIEVRELGEAPDKGGGGEGEDPDIILLDPEGSCVCAAFSASPAHSPSSPLLLLLALVVGLRLANQRRRR